MYSGSRWSEFIIMIIMSVPHIYNFTYIQGTQISTATARLHIQYVDLEGNMTDQTEDTKPKSHHDPKVLSAWIGILFVIGLIIGFIVGNPPYGALIGIVVGFAIGWARSKRSF